MKKFAFIALLILIFQVSHAQEAETKNKWFLGGSASLNMNSFSDTNEFEESNNYFVVSPYVAKEISSRMSIGIGLTIAHQNIWDGSFISPGPSPLSLTTTQIGVELFSRYIVNPKSKFNFYVQPHAGYYVGGTKQEEDKINDLITLSLGVATGFQYNINDKFRAIMNINGLRYIHNVSKATGTDFEYKSSNLDLNLSLSAASIGFEMRF